MSTIGIITHSSVNYGAVLQAYALQKTINNMGFASEIIDYRDEARLNAGFSGTRRLRRLVWHGVVKNLIAGRGRHRRTEKFRYEHLRLSKAKYRDMRALRSNPPLYDIYVTGSDQVWNPNTIMRDSSYLLTFAPTPRIRVSYGASFGVSQIDPKMADDYIEPLKRINYLSVRELEGRDIVKKLTGTEPEVVLDPTLLLDQDQWRQVAVPFESLEPYILCYFMPGDKKVNNSIYKLAHQVSTSTGWGVICIGQREYQRLNPRRRSIFNAGPAEFLGLFHDAAFVITNSFHGTAFAINFRKPFYVPINQELPQEIALSSRITTLLETLKLGHRLLPVGGCISPKNFLEVDYDEAEILLKKNMQRSINFIKNALGEG